jgi:recombination protein RecA
MATASVATLRSQIEVALRGRVPQPFTYRDRNVLEVVSTGIPEMDACFGGLPRGAMTEICGPACSGRTSLLLSALATRTADGEVCALVDARDSFDPISAAAAGVALKQLLWVRCQNIDQALRATDLLIQGGGFGLVAVDLSDVPARLARQVPLNAWFRFRRAVEDTPTILLLLGQESNAKTCASLVLRLDTQHLQWSTPSDGSKGSFQTLTRSRRTPEVVILSEAKNSAPSRAFCAMNLSLLEHRGKEGFFGPNRGPQNDSPDVARASAEIAPGFSRLLRGYEVCSEIVRSRMQADSAAQQHTFQVKTMWSGRSCRGAL